jgi:four helix bundle protein
VIRFDFQKLDVYKIATDFVCLSGEVIKLLPRGNSHIADQLIRASTSITLNIAEGAGEFSNSEKARFYRYAKRSATECAAILDVCKNLRLTEEEHYDKGQEMLDRVFAMLVRMTRRYEKPDADADADAYRSDYKS